jgi:hypothetical protein
LGQLDRCGRHERRSKHLLALNRGFDCLEIRRDNAPEEIAEARASAREAVAVPGIDELSPATERPSRRRFRRERSRV